MRRGCCNVLMISISLSTLRRSSFFGTDTYLAASARPVAFSTHLYTVPNLPLWRNALFQCGKVLHCVYPPAQLGLQVELRFWVDAALDLHVADWKTQWNFYNKMEFIIFG